MPKRKKTTSKTAAHSKSAPIIAPARHWGCWAAIWLANVLLWLLLVGAPSKQEFAAAPIAATVACFATVAFRNAAKIRFHPTPTMLMQAWRVPGDLADGVVKVLRVSLGCCLGRNRFASRMRAMPFDIGGEDSRAMARRALAVTFVTVSPNTIVLGFVPGKDLLLYHQLLPADDPMIAKRLGAAP